METIDIFNLLCSFLAVIISAITAWLTLFRKGTLKMTRPNIICFAFDPEKSGFIPKVFLRSLLYSTASRGVVIENMYVKVLHNGYTFTFSTWGYGKKDDLVRGSGVFVGQEGILSNHHFLLPISNNKFEFNSGNYIIEIYASIVGSEKQLKLNTVNLSLNDEQSKALKSKSKSIWFDWMPELEKYISELNNSIIRVNKITTHYPSRNSTSLTSPLLHL